MRFDYAADISPTLKLEESFLGSFGLEADALGADAPGEDKGGCSVDGVASHVQMVDAAGAEALSHDHPVDELMSGSSNFCWIDRYLVVRS